MTYTVSGGTFNPTHSLTRGRVFGQVVKAAVQHLDTLYIFCSFLQQILNRSKQHWSGVYA